VKAERIYTFEQVAEHFQGLVTVHWLKKHARLGNIETTPYGRSRALTESQLAQLVRDGVSTVEQRSRPQPARTKAARQPKPAAHMLPPASGADGPLVFDRTRSRRYRAGGAA
jgi:hypothetical protein